jgi:hypothetical protein
VSGSRRDLGAWPIRLAWLLLPLVAGPAIGGLLDERSSAVGWVAGGLAFAGWAAGVVAALVPHPLGLTALRVLVPAALALAILALVDGASPAAGMAAVAGAAVATAAIVAGPTIDAFVDGASYGPERRWALRIPASLLLGPLPLAWAVIVVGAAGGPLLLAAGSWIPGVLATVVGLPAAAFALRALHGLALRWLVFVPAGFVLADRTVLYQPVLVPREAVGGIAPAERGTAATDLTAGASGLVVEVRLVDPVAAGRRVGRRGFEDVALRAFLISPVRPGALLGAAEAHRLPLA